MSTVRNVYISLLIILCLTFFIFGGILMGITEPPYSEFGKYLIVLGSFLLFLLVLIYLANSSQGM